MTIEEKAKAYDEALNWMRELYPGLHGATKEDAEHYFPELRESEYESEDEKTRKQLIDFISDIKRISESGRSSWAVRKDDAEMCNAFLTYLEKQKNASKAIEAVERIDKYIGEHLANAHDMKDSNPDKKYYHGWDDALGKIAGILQDVYSNEKQKASLRDFIDDFPYTDVQKEQKPVEKLSKEEYIKKFKALCDAYDIKLPHREYDIYGLCEDLHRLFGDIQKPAEWSEEDEKMRNLAIEWAETMSGQFSFVDMNSTDFCKITTWLKSLRPVSKESLQSHWKPSDEQMKALVNCTLGEDYDVHALVRLFAELKNL